MKTKFKNNPEVIAKTTAMTRQIGANIRKYRKAKGWTQADLAFASGYCLGRITAFENGKFYRLSVVNRMAKALGIENAYDLLEGI